MSTLTKESIEDTIEGLEHLASSGIQSVYIDMAIAGMRRLQASLEAEPVAWLRESALKNTHEGAWTPIIQMESDRMGADLTESWGVSYIPLYTAPPAPQQTKE